MELTRDSGLLLHPTSLPGPHGVGDLGAEAYRWVDFLVEAGQGLWQLMPLGPTGFGDSPYQCFSAFAGNPYLISLERLVEDGFLDAGALSNIPDFPAERVDYGAVIPFKLERLTRAYRYFMEHKTGEQQARFKDFCEAQAGWLEDYALFMACKEAHGGGSWSAWDEGVPRAAPRGALGLGRAFGKRNRQTQSLAVVLLRTVALAARLRQR